MAKYKMFNENQATVRVRKQQSAGREVQISDKATQFQQAKIRFREFADYEKPLTYEEWMEAPDECKAAILYVQFYDQITLAWNKTHSVYSDINDGVSEVLQYLNKNVEKIKADKRRFTPAYIYKVAYNCLYCLCRDMNRYRRVYDNECSNIVGYGEDELDLFDTLVDEEKSEAQFETDKALAYLATSTKFWDIIESMGTKTKLVVAKLLGENSYTPKELNSVSEEETAQIINELRNRLGSYVKVFCH